MLNPEDVIYIMGFSSILFLYPKPFVYFPLVGAILYTLDPVGGAYAGMVAGLFFGTPYMLIGLFLSYANRR